MLYIGLTFVFLLAFIQCFQAQNSNTTALPNALLLRVKRPMNGNYTRRLGDRLRLECEFELEDTSSSPKLHGSITNNDLTIYWVKNYQELLHPKKGYIHIIRKNLTSILIMKNLESFDSGSYMCVCELGGSSSLNSSSETTLVVTSSNSPVQSKFKLVKSFNNKNSGNGYRKHQDFNEDYLLSDSLVGSSSSSFTDDEDNDLDSADLLNDEFPSLNPTIVEQFDDKGFCEPYKGSVCAGIITSNYSIYSTSAQQQDLIEERLKTIIPLLMANKDNLSKRCSTFAIPSLCLFAFPLCDRRTKQPKQICRFDCKQLQQDLCKNEYFNVRTLFESKLSDRLQNFLLDCNQLPPSSDSPQDCLPIVSMTLEKLESSVVALGKMEMGGFGGGGGGAGSGMSVGAGNAGVNVNDDLTASIKIEDKKLAQLMYFLLPASLFMFLFIVIFLTVFYCRKSSNSSQNNFNKGNNNLQSMASSNSTGSSQLQPSRLRMSNVSLGANQHKSKQKSSKSSIASSGHTNQQMQNHQNNVELNPFLGGSLGGGGGGSKPPSMNNYDNHFAYNNLMPPPPPPHATSSHLNHMQHQYVNNNNNNHHHHNDILPPLQHVSPSSLRNLQEVGKGRFGTVYVAELMATTTNNNNSNTALLGGCGSSKVIVKTLMTNNNKSQMKNEFLKMQTTSTPNVHAKMDTVAQKTADEHFLEQEFYNEISLYSSLRNRYIANLIAVYTHQNNSQDQNENEENSSSFPGCMIFEHLNHGDLHEYLLNRATTQLTSLNLYNMGGSQSNLSAVSSSIGGASSQYINLKAQQQQNLTDFLYIGQQIAAGMDYLAGQNYIHKDLATRNILISDNLTIKISIDLLAQYKEQYAKDYYKFQMKNLPIRWMAPEAFLLGRYSQQSDVWSYGVCLWEIFSLGAQPYSGLTNPEAIEMIQNRQILQLPEDCPPRAYNLMRECWHENPTQRPIFADILNQLRNWENYYLFNNHPGASIIQSQPPQIQHQQLPQQQHQQHTFGSQSNSQTSKASSLLGNTASTGVSSTSPPPPPLPPLPPPQQQLLGSYQSTYYSPSKHLQTNLFASKFNILSNGQQQQKTSPPSSTITSSSMSNQRFYRGTEALMIEQHQQQTNSLRLSQRNHIIPPLNDIL